MIYLCLIVLIILFIVYRQKRNSNIVEVSELYYYPIKSCAPVQLTKANMKIGLTYDREWAILDSKQSIVNFKVDLRIIQLQPKLSFSEDGKEESLTLEYAGHPSFVLDLKSPKEGEMIGLRGNGSAQDEGDEVSEWLKTVFEKDYRLARLKEPRQLNMVKDYKVSDDMKITFASSSEFLITSEETFNYLQKNLINQRKLDYMVFRPNIVIKGSPPFDENDWWMFKIGDITFEGTYKCSRCYFTTVNFQTLEIDPNNEPIATLKKLNFDPPKCQFGLYATRKGDGEIKVGDKITLMSRKKLGPS